MSEEHSPTPNEETPPKKVRRPQGQSVVHYIAILFAAAFVLLALTYLMERRQNSEALDDLNQSLSGLQASVSAMKSVDALREENTALLERVDKLDAQLDELVRAQSELELRSNELLAQTTQQEQALAAMDWFWQIDEAYVRGKYSLCRSLIKQMEADGLNEALPSESATSTDRFSPAERYREIYDNVF